MRYGFTLNSWLEYLQPTSVKSGKSFNFSMGTDFTDDSANSLMSGWDLDESAKPFSYGFALVMDHFTQDYTYPNEVLSKIASTDAMTELTDMQNSIHISRRRALLQPMV